MSTVFGLHEIELQPGVDPEEYERFFAEEIAPSPELPGWKTHLLKGDRGARAGKYLVLLEIENWSHVIGTSRDRARSRRSSLGSLNSTQRPLRHWKNGRSWAHSDRKPTFRPITSRSLSNSSSAHGNCHLSAGCHRYGHCTGRPTSVESFRRR